MERILIDLNSIAHAAHQGTVLRAGDQETQAVFGTIKAIRNYRQRHPNASLICLHDGDSWRKKESDVYKKNRLDTPDKVEARKRFKSQTSFIRKALRHLGIPQVAARNYEADDLAAIMSRRYLGNGDTVRLISGDRDWWQLIKPGCTWEDHRLETRKANSNNFETVSGYPDVHKFLQSKALTGDVSDNLPGVGGIGEVKAKDLLEVWGDVRVFLADADRLGTYKEKRGAKIPKAMVDFAADKARQDIFFRNMRLMSLLDEPPPVERMVIDKGEFNPDEFKKICQELGFVSIYRPEQFSNWVEPFRTKH